MHCLLPLARIAMAVLALSCPVHQLFANDPQATEAEWALVPAWCSDSLKSYSVTANPGLYAAGLAEIKDPQVRAKIVSLDKSGCSGYHHYCWALIWANRGYFYEGEDHWTLESFYGWAISDLNYVFNSSKNSKTCLLMPEMHTKRGEMQLLLGKAKEAEASYLAAIAIKREYAPAYIALSDMYESLGDSEKALEILQTGIKANPSSGALSKKLARLQARVAGQVAKP